MPQIKPDDLRQIGYQLFEAAGCPPATVEGFELDGPLSATGLGNGPVEITAVAEGMKISCGSLPEAPAHSFRVTPG